MKNIANKMTKKRVLTTLVAGVMSCTVLLASSCSILTPFKADALTLTEYTTAFDIHTELQNEYLLSSTAPAVQNAEIKGKREYSRPQAVVLQWQNTKACAQYVIEISEDEAFSDPRVVFSNTTSVSVYNLKIATKYYWRVRENVTGGALSQTGTFETAAQGPRNLYVEGVTNVRDMGGRMTESGVRMVQGLLYRGARLNNSYPEGFVTSKDIRDKNCIFEAEITKAGEKVYTDIMKIKTELDLRALNGNGFPENADGSEGSFATVEGTTYMPIPMSGNADAGGEKEQIKKVFELLANKNSYPVYFHCNIGTNRTGFIAYLVGALCGMSEDDLHRDYMFSNYGTIALPTPLSTDRQRAELFEITDEVDGVVGIDRLIKTYQGSKLSDKTKAFLEDCGITAATYNAVVDIMLGKTQIEI